MVTLHLRLIKKKSLLYFNKCWHGSHHWSRTAHKVGFPPLPSAKIHLPPLARCPGNRGLCFSFFETALLFRCENSQHGVAHPPLARHCCHSRSAESSLPFQLANVCLRTGPGAEEPRATGGGTARRAGGRRGERPQTSKRGLKYCPLLCARVPV